MKQRVQDIQETREMIQQQNQSVTPSAIQAFAASEGPVLTSLATAITALGTGITALDALITQLQNSSGTISASDQALLDQIQAQSNALVTQVNAISTAPPGTVVPVTPTPVVP